MKRIVIVGGGVSGLIASWAFKQCKDVQVQILEANKPGGDFLAGGLKYLHRTESMVEMFSDLGIVYTNYNVQGGILLHGAVEPYPGVLKGLDHERALRIQHDHYRKTRHTEPDAFAARSMNDPEYSGPKKALQCELDAFVRRLALGAPIIQDAAASIHPLVVKGASGASYPYDFLVLTIPLWVIRRLAWFKIPPALAVKLNIVRVEPIGNPYAKWDYVYTPYTPEGLIHRISPSEGEWSCEFNGDWPENDEETSRKLTSELNFLFRAGWAPCSVKKGLNGHLLPMDEKPEWPENITPLGRFAEWDPRATSDVVLDSVWKLVERWQLKRKPRTD